MPPWHTLSRLSGAKGVKADWRDFPEYLLKPVNELAEAFPCPKGHGCYMDVRKRPDGVHVGLCPDAPNGCDKRILEKSDLIVYQPDLNTIFSALGSAFGITGITQTKIDGVTQCWQIGEYNPVASHRFPVIVSFEGKAEKVERAIGVLATRLQKPFFLLLPVTSTITSTVQDIASRNKARLFAFEDIIEISDKGISQPRSGIDAVIKGCSTHWVDSITPKKERFPTPPGTHWNNVTISFRARDSVTIKCGDMAAVDYDRLQIPGMSVMNEKHKKPSDKWFLLMAFAARGPSLGKSDIEKLYGNTNRKAHDQQKSHLSEALKTFFGIDEEPIPFSRQDKVYQPALILRQDNCNLDDWLNEARE
jgi:hypothetical protein